MVFFAISEIHRESRLETAKAVEQRNDVIVNDVLDLWRQNQEEEKQRFGNHTQTVSSSLHGKGIDYYVLQRGACYGINLSTPKRTLKVTLNKLICLTRLVSCICVFSPMI